MKKLKLILYGITSYIQRLAVYIQNHGPDYLEVITCSDSVELPLLLSRVQSEILLSELPFDADTEKNIPKTTVKVLLSAQGNGIDNPGGKAGAMVFRYQSGQEILRQVFRIYQKEATAGGYILCKTESMEMTVIYAPGGHELQLPFSLVYAMGRGREQKTLYLNLAEFSGMNLYLKEDAGDNFSDLMYGIRHDLFQQKERFSLLLQSVLHHGEGIDYIQPPENPQDIYEIKEETLEILLQLLEQQTDYQVIIWNCGFFNHLTEQIIRHCKKVWCLTRESTLGRCRKQEFIQYLEKTSGEKLNKEKLHLLHLPVGTTAFPTGAVALPSLQEGEFARQVRKLTGLEEENYDTGDGPAASANSDAAGYDTGEQ